MKMTNWEYMADMLGDYRVWALFKDRKFCCFLQRFDEIEPQVQVARFLDRIGFEGNVNIGSLGSFNQPPQEKE